MTMLRRHAFVSRHTRPRRPPHVPEVRLYLADRIEPLWRAVEEERGARGARGALPPFWAFAWAGGQAVARYLLDHPAEGALPAL